MFVFSNVSFQFDLFKKYLLLKMLRVNSLVFWYDLIKNWYRLLRFPVHRKLVIPLFFIVSRWFVSNNSSI